MSTSLSSHYWIRWRLLHISSAEVCSTVRLLYPIPHKSHPVEARSFERRSSKEDSPGGLSWRGSLAALQLIFGMTCSNLCMYLRLGRHTIVEALKSDSLAKIAIPSNEDIESYKETIDAMPFHYFQQSGNTEIQDPGSFLQQVDAWSLRDISLCFLP